jgi:hypothetical protein
MLFVNTTPAHQFMLFVDTTPCTPIHAVCGHHTSTPIHAVCGHHTSTPIHAFCGHHTSTPIVLVLLYPLLHIVTLAIVAPFVSFPEIMCGNTFLVKSASCLRVILF